MIPCPEYSRSILSSNEFPARNRKTDPAMMISIFSRRGISLSPVESWE
jgi:hypothetical protein